MQNHIFEGALGFESSFNMVVFLQEAKFFIVFFVYFKSVVVNNLKYEGALGTESWFNVVVFGRSLSFLVYNVKYEKALGTESWFDVVVSWKES